MPAILQTTATQVILQSFPRSSGSIVSLHKVIILQRRSTYIWTRGICQIAVLKEGEKVEGDGIKCVICEKILIEQEGDVSIAYGAVKKCYVKRDISLILSDSCNCYELR